MRFIYIWQIHVIFSERTTAGFIKEYYATKKLKITFFNPKTTFTKIFYSLDEKDPSMFYTEDKRKKGGWGRN